jgi:hypothetical protein
MKLNKGRLHSISITLDVIADIEKSIEWYGDTSKSGPAYISIREPNAISTIDVQIDRKTFVEIMEAQKAKLIKNLEDRFEGFEYDPDAHRSGDK